MCPYELALCTGGWCYLSYGIGLGLLVFGVGLASDRRGLFHPKGGIGVFFGTFNPFHRTHRTLIERALSERRLERVVIHPTVLQRPEGDWDMPDVLDRSDFALAWPARSVMGHRDLL